jgi:hypothetical protein
VPVISFPTSPDLWPLRKITRFLASAAVLSLVGTTTAEAANKSWASPTEEEAKDSRANRSANLTNSEALAERSRRGIPYTQVEPVPGVRLPVRLTGRLHGVWIHSVLPAEQRKTTPFEILDARLAIALDDLCELLSAHGFVEVVHFTMYRPPHDGPAKKGEYLSRHHGGMAIELGALKKRTGHWIAVGPHWPGQIGAKSCGDVVRTLNGRRGRELLSVACEASDLRIFNYMLTPLFVDKLADHLNLEIKPGVKWFLVI